MFTKSEHICQLEIFSNTQPFATRMLNKSKVLLVSLMCFFFPTDEWTSVLVFYDKGKPELLLQIIYYLCTSLVVWLSEINVAIWNSVGSCGYFNLLHFQSPKATNSPACTCIYLALFLGSLSFLILGQWTEYAQLWIRAFRLKICAVTHACF